AERMEPSAGLGAKCLSSRPFRLIRPTAPLTPDQEISMARQLITMARLAGAAALVAAPLMAVGTAQAASTATVTVVHGIPGTTVDVYVDGAKALPGFTFKTVTKPISLPAGT